MASRRGITSGGNPLEIVDRAPSRGKIQTYGWGKGATLA